MNDADNGAELPAPSKPVGGQTVDRNSVDGNSVDGNSVDGNSDDGRGRVIAVVATGVATTIASVYPGFAADALGVELRTALSMDVTMFGLLPTAFMGGAALASIGLGRLGEFIGPRRLLTATLTATIICGCLIAGSARSGPQIAMVLFVAGIANAGAQTAVNKFLADAIHTTRIAIPIAIKQSGMPAASMLSGVAVPVLAVSFGWRSTYWLGVALALLALVAVAIVVPRQSVSGSSAQLQRAPANRPDLPRRTLRAAALGAGFAAFSAGALTTWLTSSAHESGWSTANAALLLSAATGVGILVRLGLGRFSDRHPGYPSLRVAAVVLGIGAIGATILIADSRPSQLVGGLIAIGIGWTWPVVFNIGIVRANPSAPGAATGLTQTGVYVGVLSSPPVIAWLIDRAGYPTAWAVTATTMLISAGLMASIARRVTPPSEPRDSV